MKQYRTLLLALLAVLALTVCALADGEGDGNEGEPLVGEVISPFTPVEPYIPIYPQTDSGSQSGSGLLRGSSYPADLRTALKTALEAHQKTFSTSAYPSLTLGQFNAAYASLWYSHDPEMFFVDSVHWEGNDSESFSDCTIELAYTKAFETATASDIATARTVYNSKVNEIATLVNDNASTAVQKVLYLNDYLATNYYYDLRLFTAKGTENHDAYSMLRDGYGVCESYAMVTMAVLNKLNIQCTWATSDEINHAWNAVKIGEKWYQLDVTHNDPIITTTMSQLSTKDFDYLGSARHNHFLLSEAAMNTNGATSHRCTDAVFGEGLTRSNFTNTEYDNYFWINTKSAFARVNDGKTYDGWYYISGDTIYKWNGTSSEGGSELLKLGGDQSSGYNVWYKNVHNTNSYMINHICCPGFNYCDGKLYFNTWDDIVSYDLGTGDLQLLDTVFETSDNIFGCVIQGNDIRYVVEDNSVYGTRTIANALLSYTPGPDGGGYSYRLDGSKLYLKLESGAKVIVAQYEDDKMTDVKVFVDDGSVTLSGDDWAIFSVNAETYAPLCGAVRKTP